jgi:hypothetical protein
VPATARIGGGQGDSLSTSTPDDGSTDVAALKAGALQAMAMDYRSGILPRTPTS